jgi:uncharacterized protein YbcI
MPTERHGEVVATISNSIVRIFADSYGRGPTKAKTYMVDDYVFAVLEDILTTVERTLVNDGHEDPVRAVRVTFQEAEADKFMQAVTDATGRKVLASTARSPSTRPSPSRSSCSRRSRTRPPESK